MLSLFRCFLTAGREKKKKKKKSECSPFTYMAEWPQPDAAGASINSFLWKRNKLGSTQTDSILSNETAVEKAKRS